MKIRGQFWLLLYNFWAFDWRKFVVGRYDDLKQRWVVLPSTSSTYSAEVVGTTGHLSKFTLLEYTPSFSSNLSTTCVYPNPYKPAYARYGNTPYGEGIVFSGLTLRSNIKIFNIAGELVADLSAAGDTGKYLWDTKNKKGSKVASGVYIYHITNPDDSSQKAKGKFAKIR